MPMRGLHDDIVSKKYKNVKKRECFFPFIFSLILIQPPGCPAYLEFISSLFQSILLYVIILLLSTRNPATGGGEPHGYYNLVSCLLYGKHNCLLCLQMAR